VRAVTKHNRARAIVELSRWLIPGDGVLGGVLSVQLVPSQGELIMTGPDGGLLPKAALIGASRVPAYALVIVLAILDLAAASQLTPWLAVFVIVLTIIFGVYVIWVVDIRARGLDVRAQQLKDQEDESVAPQSHRQKTVMKGVREVEPAVSGVLEGIVDNEEDVYFVYSSTMVTQFVDQRDHKVTPDNPSYGFAEEKRVTTIPDAYGSVKIQNLLSVAGKREHLHIVTSWSDDFRKEYWDANLILMGSGNSNSATTMALNEFRSPYRFDSCFSNVLDSIVDPSTPSDRWPQRQEELRDVDFALVAKLKIQRESGIKICLIIGGVGPVGTLAGCHFLESRIKEVHRQYKDSAFAYILRVERQGLGFTSPRIERQTALPVVPA